MRWSTPGTTCQRWRAMRGSRVASRLVERLLQSPSRAGNAAERTQDLSCATAMGAGVRPASKEIHSMRIGVLTGGGDCPGLNAVIRAVGPQGRRAVYGHEFVGFRDGWRGPLGGRDHAAGRRRRSAASCPVAAPSSDPPAPTHSRSTAASTRSRTTLASARHRRADRDRRRRHPRRRDQARRAGRQRRRRAEDDRQRPWRHRLHLRLRHRRQHRHGGDRPPAHHGREPPPHAGRRGDGPARGLDRAARRAWPAAPT